MSIFKKLYGGSFELTSSTPLKEAEPNVKSAVVIEGQYGLQVLCTMIDGRTAYASLSRDSALTEGEELNVATAKVLTLEKDGDVIYRISE